MVYRDVLPYVGRLAQRGELGCPTRPPFVDHAPCIGVVALAVITHLETIGGPGEGSHGAVDGVLDRRRDGFGIAVLRDVVRVESHKSSVGNLYREVQAGPQ